MKTKLPLLSLVLIAALTPHPARARDIVSSSGSFDGWIVLYSGQAFGVSWTQPTPHDDVTITADLTAFGQSGETGRAFLSTVLGPSATLADEVANTPFTFPTAVDDLTLFTGLDLPAGTYYLSLVGDSPSFGSGWVYSDTPDVVTNFGATIGESYGFASPGLTYLPSSPVYDGGLVPNFSVSTPTVPDASGWGVVLAASLFIAAFFRTRIGRKAGAYAHS
jgi:hypothetical protein